MFFMGSKDSGNPTEKLAIFGPARNRRGAELKVMSSVEGKSPQYFSRTLRENQNDWDRKGFHTDVMKMVNEDIGYVLGKGGTTRYFDCVRASLH